MNTFDDMTDRFGAACRRAAGFRDNYFGAAYATRVRAAIADLKAAIAEAEAHPEIGFVPPESGT
jgi:hypothetical protein